MGKSPSTRSKKGGVSIELEHCMGDGGEILGTAGLHSADGTDYLVVPAGIKEDSEVQTGRRCVAASHDGAIEGSVLSGI